ncbi:MAG: histidine phosphatase family protein [Planctomycetota bacterium]|nr:MAG: histidine phosphatase family protein [Planctomycetota bacterium]
MKLALIPVGPCEWRAEGRLLGRVELPPADDAVGAVEAWASRLSEVDVRRFFCAPDELSRTTAKRLARKLQASVRSRDDLAEVDVGLWAGLTGDELKTRYATAHRQLCDAPLSVHPPRGEEFAAAAERLRGELAAILKKNEDSGTALVVRPLAFALLRALLGATDGASFWEIACTANEPVVIESPKLAGDDTMKVAAGGRTGRV